MDIHLTHDDGVEACTVSMPLRLTVQVFEGEDGRPAVDIRQLASDLEGLVVWVDGQLVVNRE